MTAGAPPWMTDGTVIGSDLASEAVLNSAPMAGLMTPVTTVVTMLLNAAPMTTATARSITLPRRMNSLKPLNTSTPYFFELVDGVAGAGFEPSDAAGFASPT